MHIHDIGVFILAHALWVVPINLELCHSRLFSENVSVQSCDVYLCWGVFVKFSFIILNIYIVSYTKELLVILVRACEKDSSDSDNIRFLDFRNIWSRAL